MEDLLLYVGFMLGFLFYGWLHWRSGAKAKAWWLMFASLLCLANAALYIAGFYYRIPHDYQGVRTIGFLLVISYLGRDGTDEVLFRRR